MKNGVIGSSLNYWLAPHKQAQIIGGNMAGRAPQQLAREFAHVRRLRLDCAKPVLHIPLRIPDGEDVNANKWNAITTRILQMMELSIKRPWLLLKHPDQHVHILTSRVDYSGKIWLGKWEVLRCTSATQQIEKEFSLTLTPGLEGADKRQIRLTSGQLKNTDRELRRGQQPEVPIKTQLAERITKAIAASNGTLADFTAKLEQLKVRLKCNTASTDHISGISFEFAGVAMKGSQSARAFSWRGISALLAERKSACELQTMTPQIERPCPRPNVRETAAAFADDAADELSADGPAMM